jgi:hypothetical protein
MVRKKILNPERIRRIQGGFGFLPHRLITEGFVAGLDPHELLLYFFLVLVSDRHGLSYYAYDSICSLLSMSLDQYIEARNGLIQKDLIAFDGTLFQVLSLPAAAPKPSPPAAARDKLAELIQETVKGF